MLELAMKSALVTGSDGFIGRNLTLELKKQQVQVIEFSRRCGLDVTDSETVINLPKVDAVFHLAAVSGYRDCNANTRWAYETNVGGTVNLLNYCLKHRAKLILPSTYVYDSPYENYKKEADPVKPMTHYSFTKYMAEELCRFYSRVFGVDTLVLRTGNVYGAGQSPIYLIPIIADNLKRKRTLHLTRPDIERSFIFIDDLVAVYIKLARAKTKPGDIFNVSTGKARSIAALLTAIDKISGKKIKVKYSGAGRPNEINLNRLDNKKLVQFLNWQPQIRLKAGLIKLQRGNYF